MAPTDAEIDEYVERVARELADQGLPLIGGRILGWLLVCDPPEQTAAQIAAAIGASKASLSTNLRLLEAARLVSRVTRRGERAAYYAVMMDAWYEGALRRFERMTAFGDLMDEGVALLDADDPRSRRLADVGHFYRELDIGLRPLRTRLARRFGPQ